MYVSNPLETVQKGFVLEHFSAVNRLTTERMPVHYVGNGLAVSESTRLAKIPMISSFILNNRVSIGVYQYSQKTSITLGAFST